MANTISFDTLAYAKKLIAAGVPTIQAEVQAETFAELIDERLATKHGLKELETNLTRDIKEQENRLLVEINQSKTGIIKWFAAMLVAQAAIVATLVKLL